MKCQQVSNRFDWRKTMHEPDLNCACETPPDKAADHKVCAFGATKRAFGAIEQSVGSIAPG
jgi:hypothetical protein